ncbi:MAG TPA: hypothetical protein VGQ94_01130 [Terriglobales bacterium]|nr:hypothetical protein [Terriglobales bacterium]
MSGVIGFLFGPIAAAIVAFINLRRLGQRRKAVLTLGATGLGSVLFFVALYWIPEGAAKGVGEVVQLISIFLFPFLQKDGFEHWEAANPGIEPSNGWKATGWGLLGLVLLLAVAVVGLASLLVSEKVENVNVYISGPAKVGQGEEFVFAVEVENTAAKAQLLSSIDFDSGFLEKAEILKTDPSFKSSESVPLTQARTYIFETPIPPKGKMRVQFHARGRKADYFSPVVSVCIDSPTNCAEFQRKVPAEDPH